MEDTNGATINANNNIVRNWLIGIAIVLVILIAITYIIHRNDTMSPSVSETSSSTAAITATTTTTTSPGTTTGAITPGGFTPLSGTLMTAAKGETISVANQPAGDSVTVSSMTLTRESWVAVEAMDGSILGAGLFQAGDTAGTIPLLRATTRGERYEVVIYADTTDKTFDFHQDMLIAGSDEVPVGASFMAQ